MKEMKDYRRGNEKDRCKRKKRIEKEESKGQGRRKEKYG